MDVLGLIRSIAVSPDGSWVAVGFSSGIISLLDLNTGVMLGTWKAHDSEILQVRALISNIYICFMSDKFHSINLYFLNQIQLLL